MAAPETMSFNDLTSDNVHLSRAKNTSDPRFARCPIPATPHSMTASHISFAPWLSAREAFQWDF
jgi:hypothetical protein